METKVETASGATLDLHQEGDKVIDAFNSDGYVIFKGAADTDSMEEAIENRVRISCAQIPFNPTDKPSPFVNSLPQQGPTSSAYRANILSIL